MRVLFARKRLCIYVAIIIVLAAGTAMAMSPAFVSPIWRPLLHGG